MKEYERAAIRASTNLKELPSGGIEVQYGFKLGVEWAIAELRSDGWLEIAGKAGICGDTSKLADWLEREVES